jgi:RNA polymerase-binding transcription factor
MKRGRKRSSINPRNAMFRRMLEEHRLALSEKVQTAIRDVRAEGDIHRTAAEAEQFADEVHDDIGITLVQMHSETLSKVDTAIRRLEQGVYGQCADCGNAIAPERLRALPFAVRCLSCQTSRESTRTRQVTPLSRLNECD